MLTLKEAQKALADGELIGSSLILMDGDVEKHRVEIRVSERTNECTVDGKPVPELGRALLQQMQGSDYHVDTQVGSLIGAFVQGYLFGLEDRD